jgi:hypothetical protein
MSEIAKSLALTQTITHKGKEYTLAPVDQIEVMGEYEKYLEDCGWDALRRQQPRMNPMEYARAEKGLLAAIAAGEYGMFSACSMDAQSNPMSPGFQKMLHIRLQVANPRETIPLSLAREMAMEQMDQIIELAKRASDPNYQPPAQAGAESDSAA